MEFTDYNTKRNKSYVGQTGSSIEIRHGEHVRYIETNNPLSAYAFHILNNRHEYGNPEHTIQLLQACVKGGKNELLGIFLNANAATTKLIDQRAEDQ